MEKSLVDQALRDAAQPSPPVKNSSLNSVDDQAERLRLFTKLFTLLPLAGTQDPKAAILAFLEETLDVPAWWISIALAALVREPDRKFTPSVGEIRHKAAEEVRRYRLGAQFNSRVRLASGSSAPVNVERELTWARTYPNKGKALDAGGATEQE